MIIHWEGGKNYTIKTKNLTAKIGEKNQLGDLEVTGLGEYEVGGIQMDNIDGIIDLFGEGICVGHICKAKLLSDAELEKLNGIDILLIGVGGDKFSETKTALQVVGQIEPAVVIPMYDKESALAEFVKEEGGNMEGKDEFKVSKSELLQEERQVVVLNAR